MVRSYHCDFSLYHLPSEMLLPSFILPFRGHLWLFLKDCGWSRTLCFFSSVVFTDFLRHITIGIVLHAARMGQYILIKLGIVRITTESRI